MRGHRRGTRPLALVVLVACSDPASVPDAAPTQDAGRELANTCVPFEAFPGYETCVMTVPQVDDAMARFAPAPAPAPAPGPGPLPPFIDRRADYMNGCVRVHSQQPCGWCVAHATAAALEAAHCSVADNTTSVQISEPHLWWLGHGRTSFGDCQAGWTINAAVALITDPAQYLVHSDVWSFFPDPVAMYALRPDEAVLDRRAFHGATLGFPTTGLAAVKQALADGHQVVYALKVLADAGWSGGTAVIDSPPAPPTCTCVNNVCPAPHCTLGNHAVLITGYDDATSTVQFLNSWSTGWGDGGYGRMSYAYLTNHGNYGLAIAGIRDRAAPCTTIAYGQAHALAIRDGVVYSWGYNRFGQLGTGSADDGAINHPPAEVMLPSRAVCVATGEEHSVALLEDGQMFAWGSNESGQLGDGTRTTRPAPVPVFPFPVRSIGAAVETTFAIEDDGALWAWGANVDWFLGSDDATLPDSVAPVLVPGLPAIDSVAAGSNWVNAVARDGTLYGWGHNTCGQAGDGTSAALDYRTPAPITTGVRAVSTGGCHTLAATRDGSLFAWGLNAWGQLGLGYTSTIVDTPQRVPASTLATRIVAGSSASFALDEQGLVRSWGRGGYTGDGTTSDRLSPALVLSLDGVLEIGSDETDTYFALREDGTLFGWGYGYGPAPVPIPLPAP
jgi:alpha-tubulin suppressor-like RCC1 family protein